MSRASLLIEKLKITAHLRQRLSQRSDLSPADINTLVKRIYATTINQPDGRYFVYSKSMQHGVLVRKIGSDVEYITAYQKGKRTARDTIPLVTEDMKHHSDDAIITTLQRFGALYDGDNTLMDFYDEKIGRAFFLLEVA